LEATERDAKNGENRLTEILAAVVHAVPSFAAELMIDAGLPAGDSYEVSTQVEAEGKFVDMEVLSLDRNRRVNGRLWTEHKIHAQFGRNQMADYLERLHRRGGAGRLVGIVRAEAQLPTGRPVEADAVVLPLLVPGANQQTSSLAGALWRTWTQIASLVDRVARRDAGPRWREHALAEETPARLRVLLEFTEALERRGLGHMDAIDNMDVIVLSLAGDTRDKLAALLQRTLQRLGRYTPETGPSTSGKSNVTVGWSWQVLRAPACWATERYDGWAELVTSVEDRWKPEELALESPCFGTGFTFERGKAGELLDDCRREWRDQLAAGRDGIWLATEGNLLRLYGTLYLSEVITAGVTFDDQAGFIAEWAERTLDRVISAVPPAASAPASPER